MVKVKALARYHSAVEHLAEDCEMTGDWTLRGGVHFYTFKPVSTDPAQAQASEELLKEEVRSRYGMVLQGSGTLPDA